MNKNLRFEQLKDRLQKKHGLIKENLVSKHKEAFDWLSSNSKQMALGTMGGILLLTPPNLRLTDGQPQHVEQQFVELPENIFLMSEVGPLLPSDIYQMDAENEIKIAEKLSSYYGLDVKVDINGLRLAHTYGYIGAEQHLMRYPGDSMASHFIGEDDAQKYYSSGMAPGRGAWGYFSESKEKMTQKDIDREKYYIAVQTFLAKDYAQRLSDYRDFFKFRKMLIVNPQNGRAMVVVIGDSGPAVWTGKQLGGSPEVMKYLERVDGRQKGTVLYFFIDDPEDKIPLGPIEPVESD